MSKSLLQAAVVVVLAGLLGCGQSGNGGGTSAGGSLGVSRDDALLYAADSDSDQLLIIDAKTSKLIAGVPVGKRPEKVLVAPDGTVFVTNRMGRSVSVLRPGDTTEAVRIPVGVEPVGLSVSRDGKTLYVVNSASFADSAVGTLQAIDTASLQTRWEVPVGPEPRSVALLSDGRAAVTLYKSGDVTLVDVSRGAVVKSSTTLYQRLNASALGLATPSRTGDVREPQPMPPSQNFRGPATVRPRGLEAAIASPDGTQLYVPSLLSTEARLDVRGSATGSNDFPPGAPPKGEPSQGSGSGYGGGSCGATSVAAPALLTLDGALAPQVDDVGVCAGGEDATSRPPMVLTTTMQGVPVQGPSAIAIDPTGSFLFIANRESNNVAVVATAQRTPSGESSLGGMGMDKPGFAMGQQGNLAALLAVGAGPTGIAVSHDGLRAWVYSAFDHSVTRLERTGERLVASPPVTVGVETLPSDVAEGRRLFFSAVDPRMDNPGTGISCATCHLEGREDGHVWNFTDGPRQTPSLAGRMLAKTAPYHWSGEFSDFPEFMAHTTTRRMGGTGATPQMAAQLAAFLGSLEGPDNADRDGTPAVVVARGRAAFEKAECSTCHAGEAFTDNDFADVGTLVSAGAVTDEVAFLPKGKLNTPSLLGVSRSAPYLHDGSAPTLKARVMANKDADLHGVTSLLSDAEVDDLVAYLKTL